MISEFLYRNPRILFLIIAVISATGLSAYFVLPRLEDPVLGKRVAVISTVYPGADAERVESHGHVTVVEFGGRAHNGITIRGKCLRAVDQTGNTSLFETRCPFHGRIRQRLEMVVIGL